MPDQDQGSEKGRLAELQELLTRLEKVLFVRLEDLFALVAHSFRWLKYVPIMIVCLLFFYLVAGLGFWYWLATHTPYLGPNTVSNVVNQQTSVPDAKGGNSGACQALNADCPPPVVPGGGPAHTWSIGGIILTVAGLILMLVLGVWLEKTANKSKLKTIGARVLYLGSLLGGLTLFQFKEFQLFGKLADHISFPLSIGNAAPTARIEAGTLCTVWPFGDAEESLDKNMPELQRNLMDCMGKIDDRLNQKAQIGFVLLVGHADKRSLRQPQKAIFGRNDSLALGRALSVEKHLLDKFRRQFPELSSRIVAVSSGAGQTGTNVASSDLAKDRSVDIHIFWTLPPGSR